MSLSAPSDCNTSYIYMLKFAVMLFLGAVMESKPQLVGIHERVRSDIEGKTTPPPAVQPNGSLSTAQGVKRIATATNPNAEDAAELLRYILFS